MTENERTCKLVKIVAASDISKPLINDKVTYLLDNQTMTIYAPWTNCGNVIFSWINNSGFARKER